MTPSDHVPDGSKVPSGLYAPPASGTDEHLGAAIGWPPLAALATGMLVSIAWALYGDLHFRGSLSKISVLRMTVSLMWWGGATALLVGRVSWARVATRVLALLMTMGTVYSMKSGGSFGFYVAACLRAISFAAVVALLHAPARKKSH